MKLRVVLLSLLCIMLCACHSRQNEALVKKSSSGKTCEVLLAADKTVYYGLTKQLLDSILRAPMPCLPQSEPRFDLINVPASSLRNTAMFQMHRNIILLDVNPENPDKLYISRDRWAAPQVIVDVAARTDSSLCRLLRVHQAAILHALYEAEYERMIGAFYRDRNVDLMQRFRKKFGFEITLQQDYSWAEEDDGFVWIRKETKDFGLGILVNAMPYRSQDQLAPARIENRLDTIMRRHVAGPADGSYMGIEHRDEVLHQHVDYEGSPYCIETRALWRLFGDFMGGPMVAYTLLSPDKRQVIDVVGYVYCPRFDKRNYLMQVEGICRSVKFDE